MAGCRLNRDERARIEAGIAAGETDEEIAAAIGRHRTTVWRETRAAGGRDGYRATAAQHGATARGRRPKQRVLAAGVELARLVEHKLRCRWSPHAIVAWLRARGGPRCCAETIYRAAYANRDDTGLAAGSWKLLPGARRRRRARARAEDAKRRNVLGPIVNVELRPAGAADRSEAGHWEGDLIKGAHNRSSTLTLVERVSRFTLLGHLADGASADATRDCLIELFDRIPAELRFSLTWDQGREMARWAEFQDAMDVPVFFCDPHSPWQRPSNENGNRQLRRWLPKSTDLNHYSIDLDAIAHDLNAMPRRIHDWSSAADRYAALCCNNR